MSDVKLNNEANNNGSINNNNNVDESAELSPKVLEAYKALALERAILEYELETRPVSGVGENSYGQVLQVTLNPTRTLPTFCAVPPFISILKMSPKNPARRAHMRVVDFYTREVFMYQKVLSEFETLHAERMMATAHYVEEQHFDIVPAMLYSSLNVEDEFIIFDDLSQQQFTQNSRIKMPTSDLVVAALKALAHLHAMSFVLQARKPQVFKALVSQMDDNLFTDIEPVSIEFGKKYVRRTRTMLEEEHSGRRSSSSQQLVAVLHYIEQNFKDICLHAVDGATCAPYAVICHGDFWNNNILYKYDNNEATAAMLIDFQMSRYGSPVLDVVHYLFACTEKDLRDAHFQEFTQTYYDTLAQHLRYFALDPMLVFPKEVFASHLKQYGVYGFCMSAFAIPFFISNTSEIPDMDEVSQAIQDLSSTEENSDSDGDDDNKRQQQMQMAHKGNSNAIKENIEEDKCRELVEEYELLTERTMPIFKRRMTGIVADLVKYDMAKALK